MVRLSVLALLNIGMLCAAVTAVLTITWCVLLNIGVLCAAVTVQFLRSPNAY
jgi:hypothetical protein